MQSNVLNRIFQDTHLGWLDPLLLVTFVFSNLTIVLSLPLSSDTKKNCHHLRDYMLDLYLLNNKYMIKRYIQNRLVKIIKLTKVNNGTTRRLEPLISRLITSTRTSATSVLRQAPSLNESAKVPSLTSASPCTMNVFSLLFFKRQFPKSQQIVQLM